MRLLCIWMSTKHQHFRKGYFFQSDGKISTIFCPWLLRAPFHIVWVREIYWSQQNCFWQLLLFLATQQAYLSWFHSHPLELRQGCGIALHSGCDCFLHWCLICCILGNCGNPSVTFEFSLKWFSPLWFTHLVITTYEYLWWLSYLVITIYASRNYDICI